MVVDSYQENIEKKLGKLQNELLTPIRNYMEQLLNVKIPIHSDFETTELSPETRETLYNYFKSLVYLIKFLTFFNKSSILNFFIKSNWNLVALESLAGTMKSTSLALSLIKNKITIEEAFKLSRLEEDYQAALFGKVDFFFN